MLVGIILIGVNIHAILLAGGRTQSKQSYVQIKELFVV